MFFFIKKNVITYYILHVYVLRIIIHILILLHVVHMNFMYAYYIYYIYDCSYMIHIYIQHDHVNVPPCSQHLFKKYNK